MKFDALIFEFLSEFNVFNYNVTGASHPKYGIFELFMLLIGQFHIH